jgi:hypothetical protein
LGTSKDEGAATDGSSSRSDFQTKARGSTYYVPLRRLRHERRRADATGVHHLADVVEVYAIRKCPDRAEQQRGWIVLSHVERVQGRRRLKGDTVQSHGGPSGKIACDEQTGSCIFTPDGRTSASLGAALSNKIAAAMSPK